VTVEVVAELPSLAMLAWARETVAEDEVSDRQGIRLLPVHDGHSGDDGWALRAAEDAAIEGGRADGGRAAAALYRATVAVSAWTKAALLRCQVLHAGTASDASGRYWNAAPHPTEETLIAIEVERSTATPEGEAEGHGTVPVPGRADFARMRPGVRTIRVVVGEGGEVEVAIGDG
jgi:hypothetical protein